MINLYTEKIEDKSTREAFSDLQQEMGRMPFVSGNWQFIEVDASNAASEEDAGGGGEDPGISGEVTGVVKDFIGKTLPPGYVFARGGTIGNASSLASERANEDTFKLFELLWTDYDAANDGIFLSDTLGNLQPRGVSARADFDLNYKITVPDFRGYVAVGRDNMGGAVAGRITVAGSGLNGTKMLAAGGAQTHTLTSSQIPSHYHSHSGAIALNNAVGMDWLGHSGNGYDSIGGTSLAFAGTGSSYSGRLMGRSGSTGGSQAHNNVQPSRIVNKIIAL